jgi:hypothetical protein
VGKINKVFNPINGMRFSSVGRFSAYGAGIGAVSGVMSDDSSIVGGALKGSTMGAGIGLLHGSVGRSSYRKKAGAWLSEGTESFKEGYKSRRAAGSAAGDAYKQAMAKGK